jgi:hypothetical protein
MQNESRAADGERGGEGGRRTWRSGMMESKDSGRAGTVESATVEHVVAVRT